MSLKTPFGEHGVLGKDIDWLVPCCGGFLLERFFQGKQEVPSDAIKLAHIKG